MIAQPATAVREYARTGLGVLPLPPPDEPLVTGDGARAAAVQDAGSLPAGLSEPAVPPAPDDPTDRARYRWLLGHQVAFCVWRRLAEELAGMATDGLDDAGLVRAAAWYDRYTAMILYAGSCGEPLYRTVIRPDMVAAHPAFSGLWARDVVWVRRLLGTLRVPATSPLKAAIRRNRVTHMAIAGALVPNGASLMRESGRRGAGDASTAEQELFDRFFMVTRTTVSEDQFQAHATCRAAAVLGDLTSRPIDLPGCASAMAQLPDDIPTIVRDAVLAFARVDQGGQP